MTPPLKPGERVAVYWYDGRFTGTVIKDSASDTPEAILVRFDSGSEALAHTKQCRRLKKHKRREWWIARSPRTGAWNVFDYNPQNADEPSPEVVKVREVKPTPAPGGENG